MTSRTSRSISLSFLLLFVSLFISPTSPQTPPDSCFPAIIGSPFFSCNNNEDNGGLICQTVFNDTNPMTIPSGGVVNIYGFSTGQHSDALKLLCPFGDCTLNCEGSRACLGLEFICGSGNCNINCNSGPKVCQSLVLHSSGSTFIDCKDAGVSTFDVCQNLEVTSEEEGVIYMLCGNATSTGVLASSRCTGQTWNSGLNGVMVAVCYFECSGNMPSDGLSNVYYQDLAPVASFASGNVDNVCYGSNTTCIGAHISCPPQPSLTPSVSSSKTLSPSVSLTTTTSLSRSPSLSLSKSISASSTPTNSRSTSLSRSLSRTKSASSSSSPTKSASNSLSKSLTRTKSVSATKSASISLSKSLTRTKSVSATKSASNSLSKSLTRTKSISSSSSPTKSLSTSFSRSLTRTKSVSGSSSPTKSLSNSLPKSLTRTKSASGSSSPTKSTTLSFTPTRSNSRSSSGSPSVSFSVTRSMSLSGTGFPSATVTSSLSRTKSASSSLSRFLSLSVSFTHSFSVTPSITGTEAASSPSTTATRSYTNSPNVLPTSQSVTTTNTPSKSSSMTGISTSGGSTSASSVSISIARVSSSRSQTTSDPSVSKTKESKPTRKHPKSTPTLTKAPIQVGFDCGKDEEIICPDGSCAKNVSSCDGSVDSVGGVIEESDYTFLNNSRNRTVELAVYTTDKKRFVGKISFPPGTIPVGWTVEIRDGKEDEDKLKKKKQCDKEEERSTSSPFSIRVYDPDGNEQNINGLEDEIQIGIWAQLSEKEKEKACVGYTEDELDEWKCLQDYLDESGQRDSVYVRSRTTHLTTFSVLLSFSDPCADRVPYIIAVGACLGFAIVVGILLVCLAYTKNPLQVYLIGSESKRIYDLRVLEKRVTPKISETIEGGHT